MNAAIYAYKNCSDDAGKKSIKAQINSCLEYATKENFVVNPDHIYIDMATTSNIQYRKGIHNLLRSAQEKLFDAVLVLDLSRISRNLFLLQSFVQQLSLMEISVLSVTDDEEAKIIGGIKEIIIETYSDYLRKNTIRGCLLQKEYGYFLAEQPFGYERYTSGDLTTDKKGHSRPGGHKMRINEIEAAVVLKIFTDYAEGKAISLIVNELNNESICCKKGTMKIWGKSTISRILRNKKYVGIWTWGIRQNKRDPHTGIVHKKIREEGPLFIRECDELRIIPQELWEQVQEKLSVVIRRK